MTDHDDPALPSRHPRHRPRTSTTNSSNHNHHSAPRRNARREKLEEPAIVLRLHGARQGAFVIGPRRSIFSVPDGLTPSTPAADIIACPAFDPANPETSCPLGPRCHFVHVDTAQLRDHPIHVNYAWRSLEDVTYDRYAAGQRLEVSPPNLAVTADVMDSSLALKTKALAASRKQLSHCAHYYFNRTCNLGSECRFVHAVFIDPNAKDHQRAPAPVQLGRVAVAISEAVAILLPHPSAPQVVKSSPTAIVALDDAGSNAQPHPHHYPFAHGPPAPAADVSAAASTRATSSAAGPVSRKNSSTTILVGGNGAQPHPPRQHRPYDATPLPSPITATSDSNATSSSTNRGSPVVSPDAKRGRSHGMSSANSEHQQPTQH